MTETPGFVQVAAHSGLHRATTAAVGTSMAAVATTTAAPKTTAAATTTTSAKTPRRQAQPHAPPANADCKNKNENGPPLIVDAPLHHQSRSHISPKGSKPHDSSPQSPVLKAANSVGDCTAEPSHARYRPHSHAGLVPLQLVSATTTVSRPVPIFPSSEPLDEKSRDLSSSLLQSPRLEAEELPRSVSRTSPPRPTNNRATTSPSSAPSSPRSPLNRDAATSDSTHSRSPPQSRTTDGPRLTPRRAPASFSANGAATSDGPPLSLNTQRLQTAGTPIRSSHASTPEEPAEEELAQTLRELGLPESLSFSGQSTSADDERSPSPSSRQPTFSRQPSADLTGAQSGTANTPVRVPPIRSFRSSGSRRSLRLDMNFSRPYEAGKDSAGEYDDNTISSANYPNRLDGVQLARPSSTRQRRPLTDDNGDIFLRIAKEDADRYGLQSNNAFGDNDATAASSRPHRSLHRRPLSTNVASYQPTSPPQLSRRLSDQQDRPRPKYEEDRSNELTRSATVRSVARDKASSAHTGEDGVQLRGGGASLRPSPLTPRSPAFHEHEHENPTPNRRRASVTESNSNASHGRASTYRPGHGYSKTYSSSPLVRSFDLSTNRGPDGSHGMEGTESTASTTAPSTVWDELDDLKSRINRLELTGKLPSTSGAAVSKLADERPATATTTVTTASLSPKRTAGLQVADARSSTPLQRETQPLLQSALARSKAYLSSEVFLALESAANDAIALSSMMSGMGHPPVSGAASLIGAGHSMTDRQIRRKADSVCRSLTELCVALGEGHAHSAGQQHLRSEHGAGSHLESPATPTIGNFSTSLHSHRHSLVEDHGIPKSTGSPRPLSKFEERRNSILNGSSIPSPRPSAMTGPSTEPNLTRRSSLLVARTRRAGTEEPEDGRISAGSRFKVAANEEHEEGRKTSLLRSRRGTVGDDNGEKRFQSPVRANTDVSSGAISRAAYAESQHPDTASQVSSVTGPRRRFVSSTAASSRLVMPASSTGAPPRKYLERTPVERDVGSDRSTRRLSLGQTISHSRAGSLNWRQNRNSAVNPGSPSTAAPNNPK